MKPPYNVQLLQLLHDKPPLNVELPKLNANTMPLLNAGLPCEMPLLNAKLLTPLPEARNGTVNMTTFLLGTRGGTNNQQQLFSSSPHTV